MISTVAALQSRARERGCLTEEARVRECVDGEDGGADVFTSVRYEIGRRSGRPNCVPIGIKMTSGRMILMFALVRYPSPANY